MKKRKKRKISFIVLGFLFIIGLDARAQSTLFTGQDKKRLIFEAPVNSLWKPAFAANYGKVVVGVRLQPHFPAISVIPAADYYALHMGFMCKREWQLEKASHIPVRIRLGSLDECNFLEGKSDHVPGR